MVVVTISNPAVLAGIQATSAVADCREDGEDEETEREELHGCCLGLLVDDGELESLVVAMLV